MLLHSGISCIPVCSIKRSVPMTEQEARTISEETHLFGYKPDVIPYQGQWYLNIRGDGADDKTVTNRLARLRGV